MAEAGRPRAGALLLAAALSLGGGAEAADPIYAIVGGRVVTGSGQTLDAGTVVLRRGLVEAVGRDLTPPPGARVIDAKGLVVTPGLIDAFGGIGLPTRTRGTGIPGPGSAPATSPPALNAKGSALDLVRAADAVRARDEGITTALVVSPDGVVPGTSVLVNLATDTLPPPFETSVHFGREDGLEGMVLRAPYAFHVHMTTQSRQYPTSLMGTVAYVRQALLDAAHHQAAWAAYEKAPAGRTRPRYDATLSAWAEVASGRLPLVVTATRENDIRRALALADEFKVRLVLAGVPQASRLGTLLKERKVPLLVSVNFDPRRAEAGFGGGRDEDAEKRDIAEAEANPAALHEAGVPFALVSGHGPRFLAGVRTAIERGLPREAALHALTTGAAAALGLGDRLGSLAPGQIANVTVWSADPLTRDARARYVFVDGRLHEPEARPRREETEETP